MSHSPYKQCFDLNYYLCHRLASGEGIVTLAVTLCVSAALRVACYLLIV